MIVTEGCPLLRFKRCGILVQVLTEVLTKAISKMCQKIWLFAAPTSDGLAYVNSRGLTEASKRVTEAPTVG